MSRKNIKNSKEVVVDEYLNMLGNGYDSLREQIELFGGHKFSAIKKEAERRFKSFENGKYKNTQIECFYIYNSIKKSVEL